MAESDFNYIEYHFDMSKEREYLKRFSLIEKDLLTHAKIYATVFYTALVLLVLSLILLFVFLKFNKTVSFVFVGAAAVAFLAFLSSITRLLMCRRDYKLDLDELERSFIRENKKISVLESDYNRYNNLFFLSSASIKYRKPNDKNNTLIAGKIENLFENAIKSDIAYVPKYEEFYRLIEERTLEDVPEYIYQIKHSILPALIGIAVIEIFTLSGLIEALGLIAWIVIFFANVFSIVSFIRIAMSFYHLGAIRDEYKDELEFLKKRFEERGFSVEIPECDMHKYDSVFKLMSAVKYK